ncbi:MAG: GDSL-type esterase/lipase family protein [Myxococcota bacterium]
MTRAAGSLLSGLLVFGCARPDGGSAPAAQPAAVPAEPEAEAPAVEAPPRAPRTTPVDNDRARAAHLAAQTALDGQPLSDNALVHFVPADGGSKTPAPLSAFHDALRGLKADPDGEAKVRVAFYGASSVAADRYTGYLRHYLQARFGDAGPGFVALVPLWRWHRHGAVRVTASKHWQIEHAQRKTGKLDGRYGLLGASAHSGNKRARAELKAKKATTDISSVEVWYLAQPDGGTAALEVMGEAFVLDTKAAEPGPAYFAATGIESGRATVKLRPKGDGEVRLFGAVLERDQTGVVVDALGIGGTRAANAVLWDEAMWRDNLQRRAPQLWVLAYGANESVDEDEPIELYRKNLVEVIARLQRAAPEASCLLVGPVDFSLKVEPDEASEGGEPTWVERPRCTEIIEIQRELAAQSGCAFFDAKAMMGGADSMDAWATAEPPLAKPDHLHFTPLGYSHLGRVLSDAVMADFDDPPPTTP